MAPLAALLAAASIPTVVSPAPDHVSLTVYRDPDRRPDGVMDRRWLSGFALISETRTVTVPAGDAVLRFEGVSGGIVPVSAIVTGLPGGTIEKNQDARLLSPAALVDGTLGRRVTLHRTDRASGRVTDEDAEIVAGPANGVVVRTTKGIETLGCSGLGEGVRYPGVPAGLSAEPVLSVVTHGPAAARATVTLSYLATGFDWTASYVANIRSRDRLDLFAWATIANGNAKGYRDADVQAVAGRLERRYVEPIRRAAAGLDLRCYPLGTTSDVSRKDVIIVTGSRVVSPPPLVKVQTLAPPAPPPPPPPPKAEDLGDLKLYRFPTRVDVAAAGQKQVALVRRPRVAFERTYRVSLPLSADVAIRPTTILLVVRNRSADGLGLPLPAGTTTTYAMQDATRLLLGEGTMPDTADGETAYLVAGTSPQVMVEQVRLDEEHGRVRVRLTNASRRPATVEVRLGEGWNQTVKSASAPLPRVDGRQTWRVTVPANATAELLYDLR